VTAPARILIVEDERIVALDLCAVLQSQGYLVTGVATSAAEALSLARQALPSLVLMDVRLNGTVDGINAAAQLRAELDTCIVFLTANADGDTLRRALDAAPGGFVVKPFDEVALRSTIEVALERHAEDLALRRENNELRRQSLVDPLTGLYNRRHLDDVLERELQFAQRQARHGVAAILLDLDHFKALNERIGQAAGDAVLRGVAELLRARLRRYDVACRYGGEEFVVVVPGTTSEMACTLGEALRLAVAHGRFRDGPRELPRVTVSLGVAVFPEHARSVKDLLLAADLALNRAKSLGRNRVVSAA
jgi:diguanylate cyclase (GGDEF)-like protein